MAGAHLRPSYRPAGADVPGGNRHLHDCVVFHSAYGQKRYQSFDSGCKPSGYCCHCKAQYPQGVHQCWGHRHRAAFAAAFPPQLFFSGWILQRGAGVGGYLLRLYQPYLRGAPQSGVFPPDGGRNRCLLLYRFPCPGGCGTAHIEPFLLRFRHLCGDGGPPLQCSASVPQPAL